MKFVHLSVGTKDCYIMNVAVNGLRGKGYEFDYSGYDSADLDEDELLFREFLDDISDADIISARVHGDTCYFKKFDRLKDRIIDKGIPLLLLCTDEEVTEAFRKMFPGDDQEYRRLLTYVTLGGDENYMSLLSWAIRKYDGTDIEVRDPVMPPSEGLYYPGRESIDIPSYLDELDPNKPNIGIFFHQKQWTSHNMRNIDLLIEKVEELGGNPVPVFLFTYSKDIIGSIGIRNVLFRYLWRDGPVLDCIIETMSFSQTLIVNPGVYEQDMKENLFLEYGVPVLQTMITAGDFDNWNDNLEGLSPAEIAYDVAHPEFDGQIITVPHATTEAEGNIRFYRGIDDRAHRVADMAVLWAKLRHKENGERKVAILLYMYPPKMACAGGASGLDTFQSVVDILHRMKDDGYDVGDSIPEGPKELTDMLLAGITNDTDWIDDSAIREKAIDLIPPEQYDVWYRRLSDRARERLMDGWGKPPGEHYVVGKDMIVPGIVFGNILVGFQPDRGRDIQKSYHDPDCVQPYQYHGYYQWLRYDFGADAVIHVGTHGTLEWLPGKSIALGQDCCPDYVMNSLPDIYPYIIGNPGEGTQAKRRSAAVIVDHMIPAMTRSGSYDDIEELDGIIQNYYTAQKQVQQDKMQLILVKMRETVMRMELYSDLGLDPGCSDKEFAEHVDDLYDYLSDVKQNMIKDGLHCLGRPPQAERLHETIYTLTRHRNGDEPSLRASVSAYLGHDIIALQRDPSGRDGTTGEINGIILEDIEDRTDAIITKIEECGFETDKAIQSVSEEYDDPDIREAVRFICDFIYPNLMKMTNEVDSVMKALRGGFVEPGPSGCPSRGRAQLLPTGRNFYSLDPESVPWHSSWEIGKGMADQMLERFVQEHGYHPHSIGIVIWATDTMKTGGDDVAYILWLMGIRPVWTGYAGRVKDLEVVPLEELGRPRIDVTVRISGLFRDTFPNLVRLIDRAVKEVSELDESDEDNYLRANVRADIVRSIEEGLPEDEARSQATIRIFGDAPGTYGSGTNILIRTSDWDSYEDIGAIYRTYGEYAYGIGRKGERVPEAFRRRLEQIQVTVKNSVSREYDMLDNDDVYDVLGGFNAAVRSVQGRMPMSVIGCSADTENLRTRTIDEEQKYIFRSKVMNPKWVEGLKRHGFKGAQELSNLTEYYFAWDATSDIGEDWMYQTIADRFLFDKDNSEWLREANPYAMFEMASRLLEAMNRDMWSPDEETREKLEQLYMELEGQFEGLDG